MNIGMVRWMREREEQLQNRQEKPMEQEVPVV